MSSSPPTTLGKYQIIREIARSNDIVYEAYDPLMNRRVALKELAVPHGSTNPQREDRVKRFLREAKAAGSLSHPNIMTVYEVGEEGGRHFIAMEFLDGHTLRNELDTHGSFSPDRAIEIATEVLEGLQFAHKSGVVHRDIKPENIQLLTDGRIKLTDFGIARLTFEPNLTMDGQVFGTPSYMSPEQVVGKEIDARSDLFSVGVVLYEMVAGQKPFTGDSVVSITYAIMNKEPDRPQTFNFALWQVVARALDKSPALRYSSAAEMTMALQDAKNVSQSVVLDQQPQQHNPYPAPFQVPTGNPYMTPYGTPQQMPMPQAPPIAYPYNPYQPGQQPTMQPQPTQQGYSTVPPGYMPQLPVYYPPAPRQPLIKPETKRFLARLSIIVGLLGTLFFLVIVGVWSAGEVYKRISNQSHDRTIRDTLSEAEKGLPLAERIARREQAIGRLKDDVAIKEEKAVLASLYREDAQRLLAKGERSNAERRLLAAADADPNNPISHSALGDFYMKTAAQWPDGETQMLTYQEAFTRYERASAYQHDVQEADSLSDKLAEAAFKVAQLAQRLGDSANLEWGLRKAKQFARSPELIGRIQNLERLASGM